MPASRLSLWCAECPRPENLWWDWIPVSAPSAVVVQSFLDRCKPLCHQQQALPRLLSRHTVPPRTGPAALPQHGTIFEILSIFQHNIRSIPKPPKVHRYASQSDTGGLGEPRKMASLGNSLKKTKWFAPTIASVKTPVLPFLPSPMTWPALAS